MRQNFELSAQRDVVQNTHGRTDNMQILVWHGSQNLISGGMKVGGCIELAGTIDYFLHRQHNLGQSWSKLVKRVLRTSHS